MRCPPLRLRPAERCANFVLAVRLIAARTFDQESGVTIDATVNRLLCRNIASGKFVTFCYAVVDLEGGLLVPGFQDAHVHPVMAGVDMLRCELHGAVSGVDTLDRVSSYAATHPDVPWILGSALSSAILSNTTCGATSGA